MVIGIVTAWFPSGAGLVSKAYMEALALNHKVLIYARGGNPMKGDPTWGKDYVYWAPFHPNGIRLNDFKRWIKRNRIEVLFFNEQRYWLPVVMAKKMGVVVGAYVDYYKQNTVEAFNAYDFLICNTLRHYSVFKWHKNCFYVPWGTDVNKFKPDENRPIRPLTFLHSMGWQGMSKIDRRGTIFVLRAFSKINANCRLLLYSQRRLDECLPIIQNFVKSDPRIDFIYGTFDPIPYTNGDVFLYPSRLDGIGLTLPEALSCGLPAITTDSPPMNEFVKDKFNGHLVKVDKLLGRKDGYYWPESLVNEDSLLEAMTSYLNKDVLKLHAENARISALLKLSWQNNGQIINEIFLNSKCRLISLTDELICQLDELDSEMAPSLSQRTKYLLHYFYKIALNKRDSY